MGQTKKYSFFTKKNDWANLTIWWSFRFFSVHAGTAHVAISLLRLHWWFWKKEEKMWKDHNKAGGVAFAFLLVQVCAFDVMTPHVKIFLAYLYLSNYLNRLQHFTSSDSNMKKWNSRILTTDKIVFEICSLRTLLLHGRFSEKFASIRSISQEPYLIESNINCWNFGSQSRKFWR